MSQRARWEVLRDEAREARSVARAETARAISLMEDSLREARIARASTAILAEVMNSLAGLYRENARLDDAIALGREGLAHRRAAEPSSAALIGNDLMFLCLALWAKGATREALVLAEEALGFYRTAYGPDHGEVRYVASVVQKLTASA